MRNSTQNRHSLNYYYNNYSRLVSSTTMNENIQMLPDREAQAHDRCRYAESKTLHIILNLHKDFHNHEKIS